MKKSELIQILTDYSQKNSSASDPLINLVQDFLSSVADKKGSDEIPVADFHEFVKKQDPSFSLPNPKSPILTLADQFYHQWSSNNSRLPSFAQSSSVSTSSSPSNSSSNSCSRWKIEQM